MANAPVPPPLVLRSHERGITTLTLDSPHNRNALSARLTAELHQALTDAAADDGTRAIVLTHTGNTFCAGADLTEAISGPAGEGPLRLARLLRALVELPRPVVARVTGHVRAGGLGLLGACDIAAAGPAATFAFTEARLGLAPAVISLPLLPRLDPRAAGRYYLTGEQFGPTEAARIGLITLAADASDSAADSTSDSAADSASPADSASDSSAADIDTALAPVLEGLRKGSPQGLAESKKLLTAHVLRAFDRDTDALAAQSARLFASAEAREGMTAFLARRAPAWEV
ncbi:putative enoyl-CoA hydratase [Streptomyces sp. NBRC 110611]|uniref:enoyl-CoA hydratase-related protein n=1 Tax=Streptomyces sp. NBRC 110611 TaxID=1621259 RepID=UPI000836BDC9|nr:enoyl-CoA hydratase-related protein [Streptomyces sp. NBRC 110611]GAU64869.1 putative enoyl-CoA hydratase [Streptomyces sp. NBRC 110611]